MQLNPGQFMSAFESSGIAEDMKKKFERGNKSYLDIEGKQILAFRLPGYKNGVGRLYVSNSVAMLKSIEDLGYVILLEKGAKDVRRGLIKPLDRSIRVDYDAMRNMLAAAERYF